MSALIIKGLSPGLTERGKIKIGEKGKVTRSQQGVEYQSPQRLDHFRVTTLFRGVDGNYETDREVHRMHGDKPRCLPVRLLFDEIDLNFQCRYACFHGRSLWCSGDGETASRSANGNGSRQDVPCPCGRQDPGFAGQDKCKINARLSVLIDGTDRVGGVWVLRSTSYNTTVGILSSLSLIKRITGGPLAGLPLELTLNPKTAITPAGKTQLIWIVGIEFKGSIQQLQQIGLDQAKRDALHYARIERIEQEARLMLAHDPLALNDEADDVVDEFYPDQAIAAPAPEVEITPEAASPSTPNADIQPGPTVPSETTKGDSGQSVKPSQGRRRTNKFQVDPADWNGQTELATCGVTPDQIKRLQKHSSDPSVKTMIMDFLQANTGYDKLSFLREAEAESLLSKINGPGSANIPQPTSPQDTTHGPASHAPETPEDLVECPMHGGDMLSVSQYCHVTCDVRGREGWCPICGDDPPHNGGLI